MIEKRIENLKKCQQIFINRIIKSTRVEGFGTRYCIWVQGCSIRCPQCSNRDMWDKESGEAYDVNDIICDIFKQGLNIEGITFLGGEPFDQSEAVSMISEQVKKKGYSVITFTGYEYFYLKSSSNKNFYRLLKNTDLLIDGRFEAEMLDYSRPWVGSSNQKYIFLSDRYKSEQLEYIKNKFEIYINADSKLFINGMGDYKRLIEYLRRRNLSWEK